MMANRQSAASYSLLRQLHSDDGQFEASKLLAHTTALQAWLDGAPLAPVTLEMDVSLACNDRCPRCVHAFAHSKRFLRLDNIKAILSEAADLGVKGLTISGGGEPLCHPAITEILAAIRESPLAAGLITNGGLVRNAELADDLVTTFQWIRVSLDAATERQFRFVRGVKGLDRRLECLKRLTDARSARQRTCDLGVSFLTSASMVSDIPAVAEIVRDLGFDYVQFKPKISWSQDQHHRSTGLSQSGVFEAIHEALSFESESFRVLMSGKKYASEALGQGVAYSEFHSAWFVASIGPSTVGPDVRPTLYLDCSAKYLPRWTIAEFNSLRQVLLSDARRDMIERTSSNEYCIPPEKHAAYNTQLEALRTRHARVPLTERELLGLAPRAAKHPFSL